MRGRRARAVIDRCGKGLLRFCSTWWTLRDNSARQTMCGLTIWPAYFKGEFSSWQAMRCWAERTEDYWQRGGWGLMVIDRWACRGQRTMANWASESSEGRVRVPCTLISPRKLGRGWSKSRKAAKTEASEKLMRLSLHADHSQKKQSLHRIPSTSTFSRAQDVQMLRGKRQTDWLSGI